MFEMPRPDKKDHAELLDSAHERIRELYSQGVRPIVTVPREYAHVLAYGLKEHSTWIPGLDAIVGTIGRDPYLPSGSDRVIVEVDPETADRIKPRFTGPRRSFDGVVVLEGPIPPERLRIVSGAPTPLN